MKNIVIYVHGKADLQYDALVKRYRKGACGKIRDCYRVWRNTVMELPVLCTGASDFLACSYPDPVWRA